MMRAMGLGNECYKGYKRCIDEEIIEEAKEDCTCTPHNGYKGGMSTEDYKKFIWRSSAPKDKVWKAKKNTIELNQIETNLFLISCRSNQKNFQDGTKGPDTSRPRLNRDYKALVTHYSVI